MKIDMEFARRDDCLDKMVPSDLRMLVARITELEALSQAVVGLKSLPVMSGYRELADQIDAAKNNLAAALEGGEG
jgi:hypothetical protein